MNVLRVSMAISIFAHLTVIAWASFAFPAARSFEVEPMKALPVDIVSVSELTRLKAGVKTAKEDEGPAPGKAESDKPDSGEKMSPPKQVAALPPPPPRQPETPKAAIPAPVAPQPQPRAPERKSEPEPLPNRDEPKPDAEKTAEKAPDREPPPLPPIRPAHVPRPAPPPKKKEPRFDADRIAALLNKVPEEAEAPTAGEPAAIEAPGIGDPRGLDARMSLSELDALRAQISPCWSPPIGVQGAADLAVQLRLALDPDGTLTRPPDILTSGSGLAFLAAADAARRAVLRCQPYELPAEKYDAWRDIKVNFDPREMLGG
jgi:hypothetical protein